MIMFGHLPLGLSLGVFALVGASPVVDSGSEAAHPMITQHAELFGRQATYTSPLYYYTTDSNGQVGSVGK